MIREHRRGGITAGCKSVSAAILAVSMMLATAVAGAVTAPYAAYADNGTSPAAAGTAGICVPETHNLGDSTATGAMNDTGVATYVGRNFFVGTPTTDANKLNGSDAPGPDGSYATEIEGLTVVKGDALLHPLKGFFSVGTVAFGSQFTPPVNSTVLAVGGQDSGFSQVANGANVKTMAWGTAAGLNQKMNASKQQITGYNAKLAGTTTQAWGTKTDSVYPYSYEKGNAGGANTPYVAWNADANGTNVLANVNGTDYSGQTAANVQLSIELVAIPQNGTVTVSDAPSISGYIRYKYDNSQSFSGFNHSEKLLTFTGDGQSLLQSFTIDADLLNQITNAQGVSYWFRNIPDNASVVVNVTGTNSGTNVVFQNGWRFWWGGNANANITDSDVKEISNGYVNGNANAKAYAHAAQAIMWNFKAILSGSTLTIKGGQNTANNDDPAAAMLGSILVPYGSFESHVTTNGRVMVGEDFGMANPTVAKNFGASNTPSASIIDMDQERHNLPWNGSYTSECSVIGWQKVDAANMTTPLEGSQWGIYASAADAEAGTNQILLVADNGNNDSDATGGTIKVRSLNPNATYYIKELKAPAGYQASNKIYTVTTSAKGETVNWVSGTADNGETITDGKIGNTVAGASITWAKVADGNDSGTVTKGLSGSEWTLTKKASAGEAADTQWSIQDNTYAVTGVTVTDKDGKTVTALTLTEGDTTGLTAKVTPAGASQSVTWISSVPTVADVNASGGVMAYSAGQATIKACAVSDATKCAQVIVTVKTPAVNSIEIRDENNQTVEASDTLNMKTGGAVNLTAVVDPAKVKAVWSSSNPKIATVNAASGVVTGVDTGTVTITAKAGDKTATVRVRVTDDQNTLVYVKKSVVSGWNDAWLYYGVKNTSADKWTFVHLEQSCNTDYLYAEVPRLGGSNGFVLHDANNNSSSTNWWPGGTGKDVMFNNRTIIVIDSYDANNKYAETAPNCTYVAASAAAAQDDAAQADAAAQAAESWARLGGQVPGGESAEAAGSAEMTVDKSADEAEPADSGTLSDGRALAECGIDKAYRCDINGTEGIFTVNDLTDGTYTLVEKTAPNGYTLNTTVYEFTVANGKVTWTGGKKPSILTDGTVAIADKPTEVKWSKTDNKTGEQLAGSQWKIAASDGRTDTFCVADNIGGQSAAIDGCDGTEVADSNETAGAFTVKGLAFGTYHLTETKAPAGYDRVATVYTIVIDQSGTKITDGNGNAVTAIANSETPVDVTIPVKKSVKHTSWPTDANGAFVPFTFKIAAWDANQPGSIPVPSNCSSLDDCTIALAPAAGSTGETSVTGTFGKLTFTEGTLADDAGADGTYAKTYVYRVTEVVPDAADQVKDLRYSKAVYKVTVTVQHKKAENGTLAGLTVSAVMTRVTDDFGNNTSGDAPAAAFVNTKVLTGLPVTGIDWTGRLVLLVGGGFILAGLVAAGIHRFITHRRGEEDAES
ncbi:SpaA isopeptide-forming pilin-related protein [Bifidobacterium olomucense]|uniref:Cell surface protein with Cna protein B-type domain n=1 Tax=Bifidobacterium olomucense TaxID=2675324 RepID=A0A7Y0EY70_9BIFI|nr:Cell surface protein precursor with Cna protein B-type domain [Bifidobacterium sp. DSM 109959]